MIIQARFGTVQTGVGYQFYDATGALLGSRVTAGITELPETGAYIATATVPANTAGVYWSTDAADATEDLRDSLLLDAAAQILLVENYVPTGEPAEVVPAADADASLTVVYAYTENIINVKRAGIVITFTLASTPAKSERILEVASQTMTTDSVGYAQITLQSDLRYKVVCAELGIDTAFKPSGGTFNLADIIQ